MPDAHNLGVRPFALINEYLEENGLKVSTGTIVDATIIDAPSSTKNKDGKREPTVCSLRPGKYLQGAKKTITTSLGQVRLEFTTHPDNRTAQRNK